MESNSYSETDLKIIKFDIEKLTLHLENQEKINDNNTAILLNIQSALLGNDFNEKKGIVFIINDVDKRVKEIEKKQNEYEIYLNQFKWVIGVITTVFVAFGVYLLKLIR